MNATHPAPAPSSDGSASKNEELIGHLECLSGVLSELRRRGLEGVVPPWVAQGLREADQHLRSAQIALLALQPPLHEREPAARSADAE
ncbi:MAG: hypothetical protein EOO73_22815 [Myxococcales bacterium]|nr:MAG: hypothetical protein EOO73_22815 [Myxococcales bacterium]